MKLHQHYINIFYILLYFNTLYFKKNTYLCIDNHAFRSISKNSWITIIVVRVWVR